MAGSMYVKIGIPSFIDSRIGKLKSYQWLGIIGGLLFVIGLILLWQSINLDCGNYPDYTTEYNECIRSQEHYEGVSQFFTYIGITLLVVSSAWAIIVAIRLSVKAFKEGFRDTGLIVQRSFITNFENAKNVTPREIEQ